MSKTVELMLAALALAGMYCAIPKSSAPAGNSVIQAEQTVLIADGSDPMPLRRGQPTK
jgi:hypothetical protein